MTRPRAGGRERLSKHPSGSGRGGVGTEPLFVAIRFSLKKMYILKISPFSFVSGHAMRFAGSQFPDLGLNPGHGSVRA